MSKRIKDDIFYLGIWIAVGVAAWFAITKLPYVLDQLVIILIAVNVSTFVLYGLDKFFAGARMWRVSERVLFLTAILFGSAGAIVGMNFFHHKTRKASFQLVFVLIVLIQVAYVLFRFKVITI